MSAAIRRTAAASVIGTAFEYYDFAVYNSLAAIIFNRLFFPSFDALSGTILSLSTFAVGYLARPLGAVLFGRLGDRRGRRYVLIATLLGMGVTTVLVGVLPTYASWGILSPLSLVILRFVQGIALGGEWAGAVLLSMEHGAQHERGRNASWAQAGPSLGTLLATGVIALVTATTSADAFQSWAWRLPLLASVIVIAIGLWIRNGVQETPLFTQLNSHHLTAKAPIGEVLRNFWRRILIAGGARIGADVQYSALIAFTLAYLTTILQQSRTLALSAISIGAAINALSVPYFGGLSDRYGRRTVYGIGALMAVAWASIYFHMLDTRNPVSIVLAVSFGFLSHAAMYGPQAAFITEQFPTHVRYSGSSLAYTLIGVVGGGLAPAMFSALLKTYRSTFPISLYLVAALGVTGLALAAARETGQTPLRQ